MSRQRSAYLVGGILAVLLLVLFFRGVDRASLMNAFRTARPELILAQVVLVLVTYLIRAWRWQYLLAPLGRVPLKDLYSATWVGFTASMIVPRSGEVVRPYLVARRHGIPTSAGFASIVLERLVDLVTVLVLFAVYLFVLPMPAAQTRGPLLDVLKTGGALTGLGALVVLGLLLLMMVAASAVTRLVQWVVSPLPERWQAAVLGAAQAFVGGLAVLRASPAHLAILMAQSVLLWLGLGLGVWWNNLAFRIDLPFHSAFLMLAFLTVGVAVPTPGTVGGFHEAYKVALTQCYGVDPGVAAAAGIVAHATGNVPVLLIGLALLGREGLSLGQVSEIAESQRAPGEARA